MPSLTFSLPWTSYALWCPIFFVATFVVNSFIEWLAHRFILHSKAIVRFAYEEHDRTHHVIYRADQSFQVPGFDYGVDFHVRDWLLFVLVTTPMWGAVEYLSWKPILLPGFLSTLLWLWMFNVMHRHYHSPTGSWIEKTWYFGFLREHHRAHHEDPSKNLNVCFLPIADCVLGTLKR